jgi:cation diffusion facilitator family transporter
MPEPHLVQPILLSILAALATMALKAGAYYITGSIGLLSDAAESGINLLAAVTAYLSLWYSAMPVDRSHTYGHAKIEYFSSGLEGLLILAAAVGIAIYAAHRFMEPEPLQSLGIGTVAAGIAVVVNLAAARILLRVGRARQSIVLEADGHHLMTDVWTTTGILVGLVLVWVTGKLWIDPLIALLMAGNITWTALVLLWRSFNGLMDHSLPAAEQAVVRRAIESQLRPEMTYHALRTRQAGSRRFADCHLLVPGALTVQQAHEVATRIEQAVRQAFPGMEVTVHIEPIEEAAAWRDSAMLRIEEEEKRTTEAQRTEDRGQKTEDRK